MLALNEIPLHTTTESCRGATAFLRYVSYDEQLPVVDYAHRDDYYLFLFIEKGSGRGMIDFEEYELTGHSVGCILPGQVHFPLGDVKACGWVLAVDSLMVKDEYKAVFEKAPFVKGTITIDDDDDVSDLTSCVAILHKRLAVAAHPAGRSIVHSLLTACLGILAEICRKGFPASVNNRAATITSLFKSLLSAHYRSLKSTSQYASRMNISSVYLNEAVKKTTGLAAGEYIRNEIILQAKRLLYYTNMSVKEIAFELGYEDYAYFTRLFTRTSALSPTQFRKRMTNYFIAIGG
ncbi:MAG: AraC family transcriptional regulator [Tannerella sp.]|jgi:AraC-like DNA-binding protein|nr:AraC family transcriptional regulator [Tannerella sp.]